MNKLSSALLSICLLASGSVMLARGAMAMDDMNKGSTSMDKGTMEQGAMKKDAMDNGSMKKDAMEQGAMKPKTHGKKMRKHKKEKKMEPGSMQPMQ